MNFQQDAGQQHTDPQNIDLRNVDLQRLAQEPVDPAIVDDEGLYRRFQRNTFLFLGLALVGSLMKGSWRFTVGVALGGALGLFNKRWLEGSIRTILSRAVVMQDGRIPPWTASKLILRYLILAIAFGVALWTDAFHPLGIAIGFASFVGGVMIEAGYQIFLVLKSNRSE